MLLYCLKWGLMHVITNSVLVTENRHIQVMISKLKKKKKKTTFYSGNIVVHLLICVTMWTLAGQASLSFTVSQGLLKLMSIELVMPSNHLIFCHPLLQLPSIFPSIRVFSNESVLCIRGPKYWSFSFSISPSN